MIGIDPLAREAGADIGLVLMVAADDLDRCALASPMTFALEAWAWSRNDEKSCVLSGAFTEPSADVSGKGGVVAATDGGRGLWRQGAGRSCSRRISLRAAFLGLMKRHSRIADTTSD
jgi:hypothetical protein